jgi:polyisoprenoid-binding protein YceI
MLVGEVIAAAAMTAVLARVLYLLRAHHSAATNLRAASRRPVSWLVGVPALLLVLLVGAPFVYLQSVATTSAKPLTFADLAMSPATSTTTAPTAVPAPGTIAAAPTTTVPTTATTRGFARAAVTTTTVDNTMTGAWKVGRGSQARYHIDDTVMGQTQPVVGATPDVSGSLNVAGTTVTAAKVVVNMQTITCNCAHDMKYRDMLDVDVYPTSTFTLTRPIALARIPAEGEVVNVPVTGTFNIHGVTRQVSFTLAALRQGGRIAVNGRIPVRFEDYNIENPNNSLGSVSNCFIEFLVAFDRTG